MTIEVGDTVQLASGSHAMTVVKINNGDAECIWQDSGKRFQQQSFPIAVLKKPSVADELLKTIGNYVGAVADIAVSLDEIVVDIPFSRIGEFLDKLAAPGEMPNLFVPAKLTKPFQNLTPEMTGFSIYKEDQLDITVSPIMDGIKPVGGMVRLTIKF